MIQPRGKNISYETQYVPRPVEERSADDAVVPPSLAFAKKIVKQYLRTAPMNFQVFPQPNVIDFTQT